MHSLQSKLVAAFVGITIVALAVASGVLVYVRKDSQSQQALNRIAAVSPAVANELADAAHPDRSTYDAWKIVELTAQRHGVRVLLVDQDGDVVADSGRDLMGLKLAGVPLIRQAARSSEAFHTFETANGDPGSGLTFVSSPLTNPSLGGIFAPVSSPSDDLFLVLAVPKTTVSEAWKDMVPAAAISAAVALPVAVLLAILLARYITRPIRELTSATHQLAGGVFDVDVPSGRTDEFGELARAFNTMASRVGASQAEMRTLVANVSHDLKTPLTSILGFSQAIRSGAISGPDSYHANEIIHEEANRLSTRLNDIIAVAELDESAMVLHLEPVGLGNLAGRIVERLQPMAETAGQVLTFRLDRPAQVEGDRAKLERAIENLIVNAIRHAPKGSTISVIAGLSAGGGRVVIRNPAPDLDDADLPRLFERFYRRDRTRRGQGSGLGLSIAREIANLHRGTLTATLDHGDIVFRLELPQKAPNAVPA